MTKKLNTEFLDSGREPQCPPDPNYPTGKYVDLSGGAAASCEARIPYPAPRCGVMAVTCDECGLRVALTVAGRPDDPHTVRLACRIGGEGGDGPEIKNPAGARRPPAGVSR
jgi:hypothetical protein